MIKPKVVSKPRALSVGMAACLRALGRLYKNEPDSYWNFRPIYRSARLSKAETRRKVRALKRAGLAEFSSGLWNERSEQMAGSGYRITNAGLIRLGKEPLLND